MPSISYDMFSLLQILLLIFTTLLFHICTTNPNGSSTGDYVSYEGVRTSFALRVGPTFAKFLIWIVTLYQVLYLYLHAFSPALVPTLFPQIPTSADPLPLTYISMVGYICMIVGGLGRAWCYMTLGKFFTFELTIHSSHKLIKTGPYAYIRHPSYTFAYILTVGLFLVHQRLTNFFPNSRWIQVQSGPIGFVISCMIVTLFLRKRVKNEEEELAKNFGKEWTEYASKTNRFIPGVI